MNLRFHSIGTLGVADYRKRMWTALLPLLVAVFALSGVHAVIAEVRASDLIDGTTARKLAVPSAAMPDVGMKAGALVTEDGRTLWARRVTDRRAIASITKIMTAIVALEHAQTDESVTIPRDSASVGESTSFLRPGETLPLGEVLEGLLVKSGNDAAVAIAEHVSGNEEAFVALMNEKAADLGLTRTHFANAHGLDAPNHYSTAADLAILSRYAMSKPEIRRIVAEKNATIGTGARAETVMSTNLLLGNYVGANGLKTGWTNDAGYSVIVSAKRGGIQLYAVVLGTDGELQRFRDARDLLDWGFAHYRPQKLASMGTVIGEAPINDYLDMTVPAEVSKEATVSVFDLAGQITRTVSVSAVDAPVGKGQRVGVATFTQNGDVVASVPLVAVAEVPDPTPLQRVGIAIVRAWRRLTGVQA